MNEAQKKEIQFLVEQNIKGFKSQREFADSLTGASEAIIINIRKGNWANISDAMWRNVGKQVGHTKKGMWQLVQTRDFKTLVNLFQDAKEYANVYGIVGNEGGGKTFASDWFCINQKNSYHIECGEYWNKKVFLEQLLKRMGRENTGYNVAEMVDTIVYSLNKQEDPVIIINEADKLKDDVFYFFITFYNRLKGRCGIILLGTDFLSKRLERGIRINKKGYKEIYSRLGRKLVSLKGATKEEVFEICKVNGVEDGDKLNTIYNECDGDLRRVERLVHRYTKQSKNKPA
jgi:DNA transposition AAA+ family ATPase